MRLRRLGALGALLAFVYSVAPTTVPATVSATVPVVGTPPFTFSGPSGRVQIQGPWVLRSDHADTGIQRGWGRGGFIGSTVTVPFATNANPRLLQSPRSITQYEGTIAWYRTRFSVPRAGNYAIDFQSVNHRATVWLDGHRLGVSHEGEFQPFAKEFHAAAAGSHLLVVRADYSGIEHQKATGWHRTWFNFGGINREVTVRPVGASDIADPTLTTTLERPSGDALVSVAVKLRNTGPERFLRPVGTLTHGAQVVPVAFGRVHMLSGATRVVRASVRVAAPALWSPDSPSLYDLEVQVPGEAGWSGRTGLRELTWHGRKIFVNGRRILLHGASLHEDAYGRGDALTPAEMNTLVAELKAVGANMTRSHHPLAPALLERLDAAGIMVWQEIGPNDSPGGWKLRTPELRRQGRERVRQSFLQLQLHPSIIAWSLGNEIANAGHDFGQPQFVSNAARELHRRDPGRMVGVDIWGTHVPATDRGLLVYRDLDIVGLTNYDGWYDHGSSRGVALRTIVRSSVDAFARAFPDKIIMVTEFGAEANGENAASAAGGYLFQARLLRAHVTVYRSDPRVAGMLIWILRDFAVPPTFAGGSVRHQFPDISLVRGINQKGLFDYRGNAKPAMAVVGRLFRTIPTFPDG